MLKLVSKINANLQDRYATGNTIPKVDTSQDWTLLSAWERGNVTSLRFSRAFDTCDPDHDMLISVSGTQLHATSFNLLLCRKMFR